MRLPVESLGALVVMFLALAPAPVLADGGYWSPPAYPKMPEIPAQRALIAWRDGVETLIVESAVKSASPEVAWVLPLPAEPSRMAPVDPGVLKTAWFCTRPRIVHGEFRRYLTPLFLFLVLLALALKTWTSGTGSGTMYLAALVLSLAATSVFFLTMDFSEAVFLSAAVMVSLLASALIASSPVRGKRSGSGESLAMAVLLFLVLLFFCFLFLPSLATARQSTPVKITGIDLLQARRVGSYEVKVLRAETPQALSDWLEAGGFRGLDGESREIVSDYISEGWCFALAVLRVAKGQPSQPHPLEVVFPSAEPVYPMRLTALAGSNVDLELYVVADARAAHPLAKTVFADRYELRRAGSSAYYEGQVSMGIGLPELRDLMWKGCFLTRLEGSLAPEQMDEDLYIRLQGGPPKRRTLYSARGAREGAVCYGLLALLAAALIAILYARFSRAPHRALLNWALIAAAGLVTGGITYALAPRTEITTTAARSLPPVARMGLLLSELDALVEEGRIRPEMSDEEIVEGIYSALKLKADYTRKLAGNPYLGGRSRLEKSPGNFWITHREGKRFLTVFDKMGRPVLHKLFPPSPPLATQPG